MRCWVDHKKRKWKREGPAQQHGKRSWSASGLKSRRVPVVEGLFYGAEIFALYRALSST
jgi:hypothetical protein